MGNLPDCFTEKKHFKDNILQIRIPVSRELQKSENVMSHVESLAIEWTTSSWNTANPPIIVLPFNCSSSLETKKVVSDFFTN